MCYNPLSPPALSGFISARIFSVPQLKMKLKGLPFADVADIQEAVTEELKKAKKEEFSAAFQKLYDLAKAYIYMPVELIFNKKLCFFLIVFFLFLKTSVLKLLDRTM
jgi:hypothetical protein